MSDNGLKEQIAQLPRKSVFIHCLETTEKTILFLASNEAVDENGKVKVGVLTIEKVGVMLKAMKEAVLELVEFLIDYWVSLGSNYLESI